MNYYQKNINILQVNKKDKIIKSIDRWQAHKEGILHRGFTCIIKINNFYVIQKRKHKVFDNVFDLSFSSHPQMLKNKKLQKIEKAIIENFKREWTFKGKIKKLKFLDKYYYKEKDEKSGFIENEINYLYLIEIEGKIKNKEEYSYGMDFMDFNILYKKFKNFNFAPWIKKIPLYKIKKYLSL
ncbi:MAG: hypothetical protein N2593_04005 [Patescibacteria group bacterium]|nr:hypothetical protein [Patescibacteria group bacterium]